MKTKSTPSLLKMSTTWGSICVTAKDGKVVLCSLPVLEAEPKKPFAWGACRIESAGPADDSVLKKTKKFIRDLFGGQKVKPPPYDWPEANPFTTRVWKALVSIPHGTTMKYGELARIIGRPGGARAVGRACGANPLPLFIPCHRVLPTDGSLGGFSSGLPWKRLLLEKEQSLNGL